MTLKAALAGLILVSATTAAAGAVFATTYPGGHPAGPACPAHAR
ncbi:hypothetical protein [Sphaerisporangium dianthi]|uniref:Uncharacterized protein n=1 Tax=Sphaerisporangium dianthi TaxID=1436120 RepID=A0ABV9CEY2_9ACTN